MKIFVSIFLVFSLYSCSSGTVKRLETNEGDFIQVERTEEFFLTDLPNWANFSSSAKCFRSKSLQYFDLKKMNASYDMDYKDLISLQVLFNQKYLKQKESKVLGSIDKSMILRETLQKQKSGLNLLKLPNFKKFNLIWIDLVPEDKKESFLRAFMLSEYMDNGVPIILTLCDSFDGLNNRITNSGIDIEYPLSITMEYFSNYNKKFFQMPLLGLFLEDFFPKSSSINLIVPDDYKGKGPKEIIFPQGYKVINFSL